MLRPMPSAEMVSLISFLAVLLIFFSIDIRSRELAAADRPLARAAVPLGSRLGGVAAAVALTLGWVDLFLPDEGSPIHVALIAVPGSVAVLCAVTLGLEMLWQPDGDGD